MADSAIFLPFFGVMLLTFAVWLIMYYRRLTYLVGEKIDLRTVDTPEKAAAAGPTRVHLPSHNLKNLFELPVLFYAVCIYLYVTSAVDKSYLAAAWCFFGFRVLHSLIHCTYNNVRHRFGAHILAAAALWVIVIRALLGLLSTT